ncbi:MAG: restriction endonuclease subunit S [candidate division KSB1 bacterium]|nr:restriction endonuclease subunit S [candidate division KSB1 bacterium]
MKYSVISVPSVVNFKDTELGPLPEEWRVVRLGEVGKVVTGRTPSTSESKYWNGAIPFITPVDLEGGSIHYAARSITQEGLKQAKPLPRGTVLVSCIGYIGKIGVIETDIAVTNQQINAIIPHNCDNWFLAYALMQETEFLKSRARMTTVPILHKTNFENIPIPLPPLAEQRAIAHVLRTVQEAREATERVVAALRELKKSLMRHLFTYGPRGFTTENTENTEKISVNSVRSVVNLKDTEIGPIPEHWQVVRLGEVAERPQYGYTASASNAPVGPKFLRITDIQDGKVFWPSVPFCQVAQSQIEHYLLKSGDILVARIGATTGKTFLVAECPPAIFASYLIRLRVAPEKGLLSDYLSYFTDTEAYWAQINSNKGGRLKQGINIPILENLVIPLPPLPEQREIARILQAVDRRIAAEEAYARALGELFKTLLHELMTGRRRVHIVEEGVP